MTREHQERPASLWKKCLISLVAWIALGGVLFGLIVSLTGEVRDPMVLREAEAFRTVATEPGPYSFTALYERLPPEGVKRVQSNIRYFQKQGRRRLVDGLARGGKYLEVYRRIFREEGMPEELAYLPLIESGFVPTAVSPAAAAGMWQFIKETGRRYNLKQTAWSDRRLDPFESARAAANLLKHLYQRFQSWELALAAYNSGGGTVNWALRTNRKTGQPLHFWALDLPDETRNYVPHFMAAMLIAKSPAAYGFDEFPSQAGVAFEHIKVSPGTYLEFLADEGGLSLKAIRELNPELIQGAIPPGKNPYRLRVPLGKRKLLMARLAGQKASLRDWVVHPVDFEDTVEGLASRFRAKTAGIMQANGLETENDLYTRSFVIIPL